LRHVEVVVFAVIPLIDVETLAAWVATLVAEVVAIIRAAGEVVVTCGHEVSHGTGITEFGEILTEVGVVVFLETRGSGG
jgi:surface polysaccharide O-acyltransferase-like enzyme